MNTVYTAVHANDVVYLTFYENNNLIVTIVIL